MVGCSFPAMSLIWSAKHFDLIAGVQWWLAEIPGVDAGSAGLPGYARRCALAGHGCGSSIGWARTRLTIP